MHNKIGRFDVISEVGSGGMGLVYKGRDPKINRLVALKVVRPTLGGKASEDQKKAIQRFYIEAEAAGQLSHPNIVTIYDVGEQTNDNEILVYIAMEFLDGKELGWHIKNNTFKTLEEKISIIRQLAEGLDYAHRRKVTHRDVKPSNIIIVDGNIPKITDFGLARMEDSSLTMSGTILGTPNYMTPEQVQGKPVDARSDLFSLTVVFYEMLTNQRPFAADTITSVIYKVVNEHPQLPRKFDKTLPHPIDLFITRGLAKNPDYRFQSGAEYIRALDAITTENFDTADIVGDATMVIDSGVETGVVGAKPAKKSAEFGSQEKMMAGLGLFMLLTLLVMVIFFRDGTQEREPAKNESVVADTKSPPETGKNNNVLASDAAHENIPEEVIAEDKVTSLSENVEPATPESLLSRLESAQTAKDLSTSPGSESAPPKGVPPAKVNEKVAEHGADKAVSAAADPPKKSAPKKIKVTRVKKTKPRKIKVSSAGEPEANTEKTETEQITAFGYMTVLSSPVGAEVFIDGKFSGLTPLNNLKVKQGSHLLEIQRRGYKTASRKVIFDEKSRFEFTLEEANGKVSSGKKEDDVLADIMTSLKILVPDGSLINIDGKQYKKNEVLLNTISSGSHRIYVQMKGRKPYLKVFTIKTGESKTIDLR